MLISINSPTSNQEFKQSVLVAIDFSQRVTNSGQQIKIRVKINK